MNRLNLYQTYDKVTMRKEKFELGVLYRVEEPVIFYHIHHYRDEIDCNMPKNIDTTGFQRSRVTKDGYKVGLENWFESIRNKIDSALPSRNSCLFLVETAEDAEYWKTYFAKRESKTKLYKVTLLSRSFVFLDMTLYEDDKPEKYWKGRRNLGYIEILFEGKCRTEECC